jgi:hypothetical protein
LKNQFTCEEYLEHQREAIVLLEAVNSSQPERVRSCEREKINKIFETPHGLWI